MRTVWIYGLVDPREPYRVRYVGQTSDPRKCLKRHCETRGHNPAMRKWIIQLRAAHTLPTMRLLQRSYEDMAAHLENEWIAHFWKRGGILNARKKPTQGLVRQKEAWHMSLPLPDETEIRHVLPNHWEALAAISDGLVLQVVEEERKFQAERQRVSQE